MNDAEPANGREVVRYEHLGSHIARITLDRPAARNAINGEMTTRLEACVREVETDPAIRVAILAASGEKAFCAGADLAEVAAGRGASLTTPAGGFAGFVYAARAKPWIATVQGFVLGGGLELALACDMIVASETAVFGLPEPKRGIIAAAGGAYRLARNVPRCVALEMLTSGGSIDARRAHSLGLVNRVVDATELGNAGIELAQSIAANAPLAVREALAIGRIAAERREEDLRKLLKDATDRVMASPDVLEGPRAFMEKRAPVWRNPL